MDIATALVAATDLLFASVVDATHQVTTFGFHLDRLNSILHLVNLTIADIESFNSILDRPQNETEMFTLRLMEGEKLVRKCSKVKWNVFKRWYYSKKLSKFEALLSNFFQVNVAALNIREIKRMAVMMTDLKEQMNRMTKLMKKNYLIDQLSAEGLLDTAVDIGDSCEEDEEILPVEDG